MTDINIKIIQNAHKIVHIIKQNPEKKLSEVIALLQMPAIDINAGIWAAEDLGFISEPDKETDTVEILKLPKKWDFGPGVKELQEKIMYSFEKLAKREADLEEHYVKNWTAGYPSHDIDIAIETLIKAKKLARYELTDPKDLKSTYVFYSLYENGEQMWGAKQFKEEPTGEEVPDTTNVDDNKPEEDKAL